MVRLPGRGRSAFGEDGKGDEWREGQGRGKGTYNKSMNFSKKVAIHFFFLNSRSAL